MMQSTAAIAATLTPFQQQTSQSSAVDETINEGLQDMSLAEQAQPLPQSQIDIIDVTQQFHVVDAFSMPRMLYDEHTRTFSK
jgi:hypothetical protein